MTSVDLAANYCTIKPYRHMTNSWESTANDASTREAAESSFFDGYGCSLDRSRADSAKGGPQAERASGGRKRWPGGEGQHECASASHGRRFQASDFVYICEKGTTSGYDPLPTKERHRGAFRSDKVEESRISMATHRQVIKAAPMDA